MKEIQSIFIYDYIFLKKDPRFDKKQRCIDQEFNKTQLSFRALEILVYVSKDIPNIYLIIGLYCYPIV